MADPTTLEKIRDALGSALGKTIEEKADDAIKKANELHATGVDSFYQLKDLVRETVDVAIDEAVIAVLIQWIMWAGLAGFLAGIFGGMLGAIWYNKVVGFVWLGAQTFSGKWWQSLCKLFGK